ncbi:MAG: poly-gamma-glutamate synthase PgsB [Candidatus Aminicenantes bacterium]|nr:poly-gamma-glutamate synthase PgsB [Candidatus Aminicenantes bacterium]
MKFVFLSSGCVIFFIIFLTVERLLLDSRRRAVSLRVCVFGTRGKSSVTRLVAAALRENGLQVLARTTGSRPVLIYPDGREEEIIRDGPPTILEGKKVLRLAKECRVDILVVELMSIRPECLRAESVRLFKPQFLICTNFRLDHLEALGPKRENIAVSFSEAVPGGAKVFILREETNPPFVERLQKRRAEIIPVSCRRENFDGQSFFDFPENFSLALAAAESLGVNKKTALRGMTRAAPDIGGLKIWKMKKKSSSRFLIFVSLFAANEPESTSRALSLLREKGIFTGTEVGAILSLRGDRGDRTLQWLECFKGGGFPEFNRGILIGEQATLFRRRLGLAGQKWKAYRKITPEEIFHKELEKNPDRDICLVGLGNIVGFGRDAVDYFEKRGMAYGL